MKILITKIAAAEDGIEVDSLWKVIVESKIWYIKPQSKMKKIRIIMTRYTWVSLNWVGKNWW